MWNRCCGLVLVANTHFIRYGQPPHTLIMRRRPRIGINCRTVIEFLYCQHTNTLWGGQCHQHIFIYLVRLSQSAQHLRSFTIDVMWFYTVVYTCSVFVRISPCLMINNNEKSVGLRVAVFVETVIIHEARARNRRRETTKIVYKSLEHRITIFSIVDFRECWFG